MTQLLVAALQARQSQLGRAHRVRLQEQAPCDQAFFDSLRSSDDIEMSLVARALLPLLTRGEVSHCLGLASLLCIEFSAWGATWHSLECV